MSQFYEYAQYYRLLYRDKDYVGEAGYVSSVLRGARADGTRILELGCGAGDHAALLAEDGWTVHGVDLSPAMVAQAQARLEALPGDTASRLSFSVGDVRTAEVEGSFDAVISLFHVMSYQSTNEDVLAMFRTAGKHLVPGGCFLFDVWYAPAVLSQRPRVAVKRAEDDTWAVTRVAEPRSLARESLVDVHYEVFARKKATGEVFVVREVHRMRYFSEGELAFAAQTVGFTLERAEEWLTGGEPGEATWGVCFVARKR